MKGKDFALIIAGIFIAILLMKDFGCVSYMKDTEPKETIKPIKGEAVHDTPPITEIIEKDNPIYDGYKQKYIDLISRITKIPPRETEKKQDPYAEPDQFPDTGKKVADCPPVNMPPILRQKDTLKLPENLGFVVSSHVVAGAILETRYFFAINKFETTKPERPRNKALIGFETWYATGIERLAAGANLGLYTKKGKLVQLAYGFTQKGEQWGRIGYAVTINLRKRK